MRTTLAVLVTAVLAAVGAPAALADLSPDQLLTRYQPVTVLDAHEAFGPTAVDGFLARSQLKRLGADGVYHAVEPDPAGLPVKGSGWRLDLTGCSPAAGLAAVGCYAGGPTGPSVVYGRYAVRAGTIVLQYWFFYDDNFWSLTYPPSDLVWQAHEGDWEVVTVVLNANQQPVEAGYSQHCTGQRRPWATVPKVPATEHPVVFVATGSHANLFAPGVQPIALSCFPPEAVAFFRTFRVLPVDVNVPARVLGPGTTSVERLTDNGPRWLRFPGTWGEAQYIHAPAPIGTIPFGTSPVGPQYHKDWGDPLGTIAGYPEG
jgi:hypothetical protein